MKMLPIAALGLVLLGCSHGSGESDVRNVEATSAPEAAVVEFNVDSAYSYVNHQMDFGPRVPGTDGHLECGDYLINKLNEFGADTVFTQEGTVVAFNGDKLPYRNILATYEGKGAGRVLLLAHWDTRPWADADKNPENHVKPVPGANDGASGVGVLLEIARLLGRERAGVTVDILFTDVEDYGTSGAETDGSWCLGTQKWAENLPYKAGYYPDYGILLDMVGAKGAIFNREYFSQVHARQIVDKVWRRAVHSGYSSRFDNNVGGAITDDHLIVNRVGIPCIDIIENYNRETMSFHPSWHTMKDNMDIIDRNTLKAVGQVVTDVIYNE